MRRSAWRLAQNSNPNISSFQQVRFERGPLFAVNQIRLHIDGTRYQSYFGSKEEYEVKEDPESRMRNVKKLGKISVLTLIKRCFKFGATKCSTFFNGLSSCYL